MNLFIYCNYYYYNVIIIIKFIFTTTSNVTSKSYLQTSGVVSDNKIITTDIFSIQTASSQIIIM